MRHPLLALLLLLTSYAALSDHHGRGKEPTDGFPGIYGTERFTLTFTGDGYLIFAIKKTGIAISVLQYTFVDSILTLKDISPPAFFKDESKQCASENEGRYAVIGSTEYITLKMIEDPCKSRMGLLHDLKANKYKRPG